MARTGPDAPIEFLAPDEHAFGESASAEFCGFDDSVDGFDDDPPRSRGTMIAAAAIVVAVLAAAVLVARPWAGAGEADRSTAPASTIAAPPDAGPSGTGPSGTGTTNPAPVTTSPQRAAPAAADIDGAYGLQGAPGVWVLTESGPGYDTQRPAGWGEVWATEGTERTVGRWFAVTLLPFRSSEPTETPTGDVDVDIDGTVARLSVADDGVSTIQFDRGQPDADRLVVVSGFGVDVLALARSLGISDDRPQLVDDRPVFRDPTLLDGFTQIAAGPTRQPLIDRILFPDPLTAYSVYRRNDDTGRGTVVIQSSPDLPVDDPLAPLASVRIGQLPGTWRVPATFVGTDLALSTRVFGADTLTVARWRADGARLTMITDRPFGELLELLPLVQPRP
ncbi:MAG: hypothetical protein RI958_2139 [Actinomycetota bacterium]|jgi:hypothetical protein